MIRKRIYIFFLAALLGLSQLVAQDMVVSYETLVGLNGKHTLKVYMQSTTPNPLQVAAVNFSFAHSGTCLDFEPVSSVFTTAWTNFLEKEVEKTSITKQYRSQSYDSRLQYGIAEPGMPNTQVVTIPASNQPKLLVMELAFKGACGNAIYMENQSENPVNQIGDDLLRTIPYIIEHNQAATAPVQWISFQATPLSRHSVDLVWETQNETGSDFFEIEKSVDRDFFQSAALQRVKGAGTTTENLAYQYTDETEMAPVVFYRLKHVDYSGAFTYSNVVEVNFARIGELPMSLEVFPNPVVEKLTLRMEKDEYEEFAIKVTDMNGRVLYSQTYDSNPAEIKIDMSAFSSGLYNIEATSKEQKGSVTVAKE